MNRREFVSAALVGLAPKSDRTISGSFVNDSFALGHKLRDGGAFAQPGRTETAPVVIVGGGIAGLSAAWQLDRKGFRNFVLLEMEAVVGGNSRSGENAVSQYPWAAHYVPVPKPESTLVRELMREMGVLGADGVWKEERLCFSPKERLFVEGRWQNGLEPVSILNKADRAEFVRFEQQIQSLRSGGGFAVPSALALNKPANILTDDSLTAEEWLQREGYTSRPLQWLMNYACRDDYGALAKDTSAWALLHYFASRPPDEIGPITDASGNGWIVRYLRSKLSAYLRTAEPVYRIESQGSGWRVLTPAAAYRAECIVFAAPSFLIPYLAPGIGSMEPIVYSPWLTANLTLDRIPESGDSEAAWDNVLYRSPALGYVDATHMTLKTHVEQTVWTFYYALAEYSPADARRLLLNRSWADWKEWILSDLERAHPDLRRCVRQIDLMRIGHAMARPVPGFLQRRLRSSIAVRPGFLRAHSDVSGLSIFEEAQYNGVMAADRALQRIGRA